MESGAMRGMFTAGVTDVLDKFDVKTFNENRPILNPEFSFLSGIFFVNASHVRASFISLARTFFKSRSAHLFGCKRPHNGSLSLPAFCELRAFNSNSRTVKNIFFIAL